MTKTMKQSIAVFAVIAQLLILLPFSILHVNAEESVESDNNLPVLNETIVGTVKFQSFNFLGKNETGDDGVDYQSTFYYTDDYFSRSAVNDSVNTQSVSWEHLEDVSMAATSMDFAVASYTTNEGNIVRKGGKSYANTNYKGKYKNAKKFLEDCKFEDFESTNYEVAPTQDSIAYCFGHKEITVWDSSLGKNRTCDLVAVGIRGAGYGAEWASNVTIGTPGNGANVVRHKGFDDSAKIVCQGIQSYINKHNLKDDVKYWVVGFSRSAAVANLAAGYLTDNASTYHTSQDDVYGYTYEAPQAASTSENALNYKNIHNILNAMDAVPKVSPSAFNHQRLGVDYVMPYYGNTSESDNPVYYSRMREMLKSIAVGTTIDGTYEADPLIEATDPSNYPYNRKLTPYKMSATKLVTDAIGGTLMTEFGTEVSKKKGGLFSGGNVDRVLGDTNNDGTCDWYLDQFIDSLVDVFLTSTAWDRDYYNSTTNILTHRTRFIDNYQNDLRVLLGYMLDFSGPAFLGLVDQLMDQIIGQLKLSNTGFALAFVNFYNDPTGSYGRYNLLVNSSWRGKPHKDVLITEAKGVAVDVVDDMTEGYNHPTITRAQMHVALEHAVALVVDLYADELDRYESQYFGTTLRLMNVILSTHEQETVLSWNMAVDPNHINRSFRTIKVPKNTTVELHQFREELGENLSVTGEAPVVARFENGVQVSSKDQRIYSEISGDKVIIRYPSSLDIRADVRSNVDVGDLYFEVQDYRTTGATTDVSMGENQYKRLDVEGVYTSITDATGAKSINAASNSFSVPMSTKDVLHIMTSGTSSYDDTTAVYDVDKSIYVNTVVEGQYIHDGDVVTFQTNVTDDSGKSVTPKFLYTSNRGDDMLADSEQAHLGRNFTITIPEVGNDHYVEKYYRTNASEEKNQRLSEQNDEHLPDDDVIESTEGIHELKYGQVENLKEKLELTDAVFHVFYSGSPATSKSITKIIDFNGKMILAKDADTPVPEKQENGKFALDTDNNATYQLDSGKLSSQTLTLTSAYSSADVATIKGVYGDEEKAVKKKVTVVPASSIYFNDKLAEKPLHVSDTAGYSADIENSVSEGAEAVSGTFYLTFYGTGIDVYCTTHNEGGYVSAAVFTGSGKSACVRDRRIGSAKTLRNYSSEDFYNTPSISFTGLTAGTYTLKLSANENAQYKLDGVRVYNPIEKGSDAEVELNNTDEANATYLNLRSVLLNDEGVGGFTVTNGIQSGDVDPETVSGVLFIDDVEKIVTKSNVDANGNTAEKPVDLYQTQFDVYKGNGPKNEIYLDGGQALTFQLNVARFVENTKVYIGLSAPKTGNGSITINNKDISPAVTSVMDMYYPVEFDLNNAEDDSLSITLRNEGAEGNVISVTNLKITGVKDLIPAASNTDTQETMKATRALFAPVTLKTIRMAANNGVDPEAETVESEEPAVTEDPEDPTVTENPTETENPDDGSLVIDEPEETETPAPSVKPDTPAETGNTIQKVIQSITRSISSFFKSIFRR